MHRITSAHFSLWIAVGNNVRCDWLRSEFRTMAIYSTWNPRYTRRSPGWTPRGNNYGPRYARSRTSRRKANAEARAARQQRDSTTVTLNRIASFPVEIGIGAQSNGVAIAHWNELRVSTYFNNYAPMYDQMKIDKIKVKVIGSQAAASQTNSISPAVVMAFDRNGLNVGQNLNPAAISTYSSSQMKNWSLGNAFTMYQTIYPSTIMEKGQYIPTESLVNPTDDDSSSNPCTPISDPSLPFKPVTLIGVNTGINQTAVQTYVFTMEFEYTVTFRGMRKPSLAYLLSDADVPININGIPNFYYPISQPGPNRWISIGSQSYTFTANTDGYLITYYSNGNLYWDSLSSGTNRTAAANTYILFVPGTNPVVVQNEDVVLFYLQDTSSSADVKYNSISLTGVFKLELTPAPEGE